VQDLIDAKGIAVQRGRNGRKRKKSDKRQKKRRRRREKGEKNNQYLIFVIEFRRKGASQQHIKALCHIGSLESHIQSQLLKTKEIQEYVANFPGSKPPAFSELQNQWQKPPQPYPKISLHTAELQDWNGAFLGR